MLLLADIRLTAKLLWRSKFAFLAFWLVLVHVIVVLMASQFSGRQPSTVALDVGLSMIRFLVPIFLALCAQETISKEFDKKYYYYSFSYPRSRVQMLLARFVCIASISVGLMLVMSLVLVFLVKAIEVGYDQATPANTSGLLILTLFFFVMDFWVLASIAVLLGVVSKTPGFVLIGTIGFMIVARSYSTVIQLLSGNVQILDSQQQYASYLKVIQYIIPDLGSLDIRAVALYGKVEFIPHDWLFLLIQAFCYGAVLLIIGLALFDRRVVD